MLRTSPELNNSLILHFHSTIHIQHCLAYFSTVFFKPEKRRGCPSDETASCDIHFNRMALTKTIFQ